MGENAFQKTERLITGTIKINFKACVIETFTC